ncbi:hypothetical protein C8Q80DRAFT_1117011 [Daedaleopsis nitida]|nr:hypothetical protein C8Q80DRAFT_1117011 [Daedaleopsis nitida]
MAADMELLEVKAGRHGGGEVTSRALGELAAVTVQLHVNTVCLEDRAAAASAPRTSCNVQQLQMYYRARLDGHNEYGYYEHAPGLEAAKLGANAKRSPNPRSTCPRGKPALLISSSAHESPRARAVVSVISGPIQSLSLSMCLHVRVGKSPTGLLAESRTFYGKFDNRGPGGTYEDPIIIAHHPRLARDLAPAHHSQHFTRIWQESTYARPRPTGHGARGSERERELEGSYTMGVLNGGSLARRGQPPGAPTPLLLALARGTEGIGAVRSNRA